MSALEAGVRYRDDSEDQSGRRQVVKSDLVRFTVAYLLLTGVFWAIGRVIVAVDSIGALDQRVAERLAARRTSSLNELSYLGSMAADTLVKIGVTTVACLIVYALWHRWREPLMLAVPLVLEASAFITVTFLVGRPRPAVDRLEGSPVNSSFPSGHVAAATVYGAIVIVVFWHTRKLWARVLVVVVCAVVPVCVGLARMYRGMHYMTDVIAGVVLGLASLACAYVIVERHERALDRGHDRKELS